MTAHERLTAWRSARGISQQEAAEAIGATQSAWASWESGRRRPNVDFAAALAVLTDIPFAAWARRRRRVREARA